MKKEKDKTKIKKVAAAAQQLSTVDCCVNC